MPKSEKTDRHHGGPGSSHQNADRPAVPALDVPEAAQPAQPTNPNRSRVSGGGGERDCHHTHDPDMKR